MVESSVMYGFIDESGSPGAATNNNDFLAVSLVLFPDRESVDKCSATIDRLRSRLSLPDDYEFHCSRNSTRPQQAMIKMLPDLEFRFIAIVIRKNTSYRFASYDYLSKLLLHEISTRFGEISIEMDSNPTLYTRLRRNAKEQKLHGIKFKQVRSRGHNLIQLADYVTAICSRKVKNTTKGLEQFRPITKKQNVFTEISDQQ